MTPNSGGYAVQPFIRMKHDRHMPGERQSVNGKLSFTPTMSEMKKRHQSSSQTDLLSAEMKWTKYLTDIEAHFRGRVAHLKKKVREIAATGTVANLDLNRELKHFNSSNE